MASAPAHDDDIPLVDNAAAASMFSPQLWVNRTRPRVQRREAAQPEVGLRAQQLQAAGQSPSLADLGEENEEAAQAEMDQLREDLQRLAALEDMYTKIKLQNSLLERHLLGIYSVVNGVLEENRCMKRLISLLQVRREDFVAPQQQEGPDGQQPQLPPHLERRFLERVGQRLIHNLFAQPAEPGQQQAAAAQPAAAREPPASPGQDQRQQEQQRQQQALEMQEAIPLTPLLKAAPASLVADSPGVPAYRGAVQQGAGYTSADVIPEEAQVAAAVLATTGGDAAAAMATLLDHAIAARQHQ